MRAATIAIAVQISGCAAAPLLSNAAYRAQAQPYYPTYYAAPQPQPAPMPAPLPPQPVYLETVRPPQPASAQAETPPASPDPAPPTPSAGDPWANSGDGPKAEPANAAEKTEPEQGSDPVASPPAPAADVAQPPVELDRAPKKITAAERKRIEEAAQKRADERKAKKAAKDQARAGAHQAALEAAAAYCGPPPERRVFGGGYFGQKEAINRTANDPDATEIVDCGEPRLKMPPHCWVFVCNVRGRNAFGNKIMTVWGFNKTAEGWTAQEIDR